MNAIFATLGEAGIAKSDLYLAWDFTVASERNLSERMLHIRDDAFAQLGDTDLADLVVQGTSPRFIVDTITSRCRAGRRSTSTCRRSRAIRRTSSTRGSPAASRDASSSPAT